MKIDIYWDLRYTDPLRHTGVGKHVIEVFGRMVLDKDIDVRVLVARDQLGLWEEQFNYFGWETLTWKDLPLSNKEIRLMSGSRVRWNWDHLSKDRDLIYSPMELILSYRKKPFINTIHGIPFHEATLPSDYYRRNLCRKERLKQSWFFKVTQKRASRTVVVSEYLKSRLCQSFGFKEDGLIVSGNACDELFYTEPENDSRSREKLDSIRFVSVGGANVFDGAPHLLKVARILEKKRPQDTITIVGDRHEDPWHKELNKLSNVRWLGFASSKELRDIYAESDALLYLPCVESFGIIGLEAMAARLPIIAHNSTSLPEVLGDAALWVDPENESDLIKQLNQFAQSSSLRNELIELGTSRAKEFSWDEVYRKLMGQFTTVF